MLSQIYEQGLGVSKSASKAKEYLELAASSGELASMCRIADYLRSGNLGYDIDIDKAEDWENRVAEKQFDCAVFRQ
ncbi:MAG: hypothetical protein CMQ46_02930 [Gammaproteobacteria bacterium]|nr:hypothetical protein [Gammaproteobacteria bacterium]MBJ54202.1 hypothetical protein [Gammaproteobacteria bacterium]|tara:strand:+ start:324 stop:551 length:228 start_codon:yes stop_codon:yes gene_type:complete